MEYFDVSCFFRTFATDKKTKGMKSIKEKAEEYEYNIGSQDYCWLDIIDSYAAGANYVLDEIENFAESTWGANSINTISLKKKIKQIKGE